MRATDEMTDAEAEALLLAMIPPSLEWDTFDGRVSNHVINKTDGHEEYYEVSSNHRGTRFYSHCMRGRLEHNRNPATLALEEDAKAACEYHHATGDWEQER